MSFLPYPPATTTAAIEVFRQDVALTHEVVHGSDTATVLTENGEIPSLAKALKSITDRVDIANELVEDIEDLKQQAAADIGSAALSAATASSASATAQSAATTASSAANFKGNWASLTGAYNVPSVVYHKSLYWQLITNTTNITLDEPSVSNKWVLADAYSQQQFIEQIDKKFTTRLVFDKNQHFQYGKYGLESKLITDVITTARASSATYTTPTTLGTALSNEPRIEYDSSTGECLGLLAEESVANLLLQSDIGKIAIASPWVPTNLDTSTITIGQSSPDGGNNAILFNDTSTTNIAYLRQTVTVPNDTTSYYASVFVKAGSSPKAWFRVTIVNGTTPVVFETTFTFATESYTGASGISFQKYPDGWYRLIIPLSNNNTGNTAVDWRIAPTSVASETGSVYFFGGSFTQSRVSTSYIPTSTSAVTRLADRFITARPHVSQRKGSIFVWFKDYGGTPTGAHIPVVKFNNSINSINRGIGLRRNSNDSVTAIARSDTLTVETSAITGIDWTKFVKAAISFDYDTNSFKLCVNGRNVVSTTLGLLDISAYISHLVLASKGSFSGTVVDTKIVFREVSEFPYALSDLEMQQLTRLL